MKKNRCTWTRAITLPLALTCTLAAGTARTQTASPGASQGAPQDVSVTPLFSKALTNDPAKEITVITVDYAPGASDPIHTHSAQAVVYVLQGSIVMQVKGGPLTTLTPGQTFYEGPDDVHVVGRNASRTARAKFLVFLIKDKGAPILTPTK